MKKYIALLLLTAIAATGHAQLQVGKSAAQLIVEQAVRPGIVISQNAFQIKKNGTDELFGLNGKNEFGTAYTVGLKVPGGILLTDRAIHPWDGNEKFEKYKADYSPVACTPRYAELADTADYQETAYEASKAEALCDSSVYRCATNVFGHDAFTPDTAAGDKQGWMVWVSIGKNADKAKTTRCELMAQMKDVKVGTETTLAPPATDKEILGGLYVVPAYTSIGTIVFRLSGIAVKKGKKWQLAFPFEVKETTKAEEQPETVKPADDAPELTPVSKVGDDKAKSKKTRKTSKR